jgi:hypothetical protein
MARVRQTSFTPTEDAKYRAMHDLYAAVGAVASAWSAFEAQIDLAALRLARITTEAALCFTAQIAGSGRKMDAYIAVARFGETRHSKEIEDFAKRTAALAERRNRVVHDTWIVGSPADIGRFEITARKKLRSLLVPVTIPDVRKCYADIVDHTSAFNELTVKIQAELHSSPGKAAP